MAKVTMPQLGESVAEGTIGKWLKQPGDHVAKYEPLLEVITDKVNAEVPSPFEGVLKEILVEEGATVPNNAEIAVIEEAGAAARCRKGRGSPPREGRARRRPRRQPPPSPAPAAAQASAAPTAPAAAAAPDEAREAEPAPRPRRTPLPPRRCPRPHRSRPRRTGLPAPTSAAGPRAGPATATPG